MRFAAPSRTGFTLIEIIACLLTFTIGALAVIGLTMYGISLAGRAQAGSTGMETARSLVADAQPLGLRNRTVNGNVVSGNLNGYFVRRTVDFASGVSAGASPRLRVATITGEVFLSDSGTHVATLRQRRLVLVP